MKKCSGCGALLQSEDETKIGYISPQKINEAKYCERCFKLTHYNKAIIVPLDNINETIIKETNNKSKHIFYLNDFLNINTETMDTFKRLKSPKILVISKLDIIPRSIKTSKITNWLKEIYNINEEVIYTSSNKKINLARIPNIMEQKKIKESYILGYTNSGKSTLINSLCNEYNPLNNNITTSLIPNTTLNFINIKLKEDINIIDSPGFNLNNTLYNSDEIDLIKRINPKKFIKPITYQTKDITSLIIEDRIRINSDKNNSMTIYFSNELKVDKVFQNNQKLINEKETIINIKDNTDLVIKGIGFINIKKACKLTIHSQYDNLIETRQSMF